VTCKGGAWPKKRVHPGQVGRLSPLHLLGPARTTQKHSPSSPRSESFLPDRASRRHRRRGDGLRLRGSHLVPPIWIALTQFFGLPSSHAPSRMAIMNRCSVPGMARARERTRLVEQLRLAILVLVSVATMAACHKRMIALPHNESPENLNQLGLALCDRLQSSYMNQDWSKLDAMVDSEYTGIAPGEVWDRKLLKQEFPKIHLIKLQRESGKVIRLALNLILISEEMNMTETYDGGDISGRYQMTTVWVKRGPEWRLFFEQEVPIQAKP
jgi:hypothetical protein